MRKNGRFHKMMISRSEFLENPDIIMECRFCQWQGYEHQAEMHYGPDRCPECGEEMEEDFPSIAADR